MTVEAIYRVKNSQVNEILVTNEDQKEQSRQRVFVAGKDYFHTLGTTLKFFGDTMQVTHVLMEKPIQLTKIKE